MQQQVVVTLDLADGSTWKIIAWDKRTSSFVSLLAKTMQLRLVSSSKAPDKEATRDQLPALGTVRFLRLVTENPGTAKMQSNGPRLVRILQEIVGPKSGNSEPSVCASSEVLPVSDRETVTCILKPAENCMSLFVQLMQVSLIIGQYAQVSGGFLLHGALAEKDGFGVLLAGPGEVGKTTASRRLPHPWHSLSDDMTLIVHDGQGTYWAHPWPTWSRFLFDGPRSTWNVEKAVPLRAVFFLEQAQEEHFETLGTAQAICLLIESAEQASRLMSRDNGKNVARMLRLQRFDNICALAQAIPSLVLRLSRNGAFWNTMDEALKRNEMS